MKLKYKIILTITVILISASTIFFSILYLLPGSEKIKYSYLQQALTYQGYNQGTENEYYILNYYNFTLYDTLLSNIDWRWKEHNGIAIFIEIYVYNVNDTYIDHLEKTKIWEANTIWDGTWDFNSPIIYLNSLNPIYSTGFKLYTYLTFRYKLISVFLVYKIREFRTMAIEF